MVACLLALGGLLLLPQGDAAHCLALAVADPRNRARGQTCVQGMVGRCVHDMCRGCKHSGRQIGGVILLVASQVDLDGRVVSDDGAGAGCSSVMLGYAK
jgi:hypothetical protein